MARQRLPLTLAACAACLLGPAAAAAKHRYRFTVTLPSNTDDSFQGNSAQVDFAWSAAQS
jgi:hypothetical protein